MFKLIATLVLLYTVRKCVPVTIIKYPNKGYYLYYQTYVFNRAFQTFHPKVKEVLLWNFKLINKNEDLY